MVSAEGALSIGGQRVSGNQVRQQNGVWTHLYTYTLIHPPVLE